MKKSGPKRLLLIFIILILIIISGLGIKYLLEPYFYPLYYSQEVKKAAEEFDLDPFLLFSMIKEESGFEADANSPAGAEGLMQLMPNTADWIILEMGIDVSREDAVWDPELNIRMGAWYLDWLTNTYYDGNLMAALAAYNAGIQNVDGWLKDGVWDGSLDNFGDIPYSETKDYIADVCKNYQKYQKLYSKDFE